MGEVLKIKVGSKSFCMYLLYILIIWGFELADTMCYEIGVRQVTVFSRIIVLTVICILLLTMRDRLEFFRIERSRKLIAGIFIITVIGLLKSVYPDTAYDTYNYHLIAQQPGFVNYFSEDFGKGNFQVWGFRLGDRLFYLFRRMLGYRYGTLLNTLVLVLIYKQIEEILTQIGYARKRKASKWLQIIGNTSLWALAITLTHYNILNIGIYYVDVLALPIGIEVLRKVLEARSIEQQTSDIYYVALLNGLWFAFKMTNIVFIVPCVVVYIVLVRRQLTVNKLLVSGVFAAIPCSIYFIVNYTTTGNPIFPYFNSVFKSQYFLTTSFKDARWGGESLFEKVFWLVFLIFKPEYRQTEIPDKYTMLLIIGFLGLCFGIAAFAAKVIGKKAEITNREILIVLILSSSLFWSFSTGYSRYYLFGMIMLGILAYGTLFGSWNKNVHNVVVNITVSIVTIIIVGQTCLATSDFMRGKEWSWRAWSSDTFAEQCKYVLKDYEFPDASTWDIDMFFLTDSYYSGYAEMINPEVYTYNAAYRSWLDDDSVAMAALEQHKELLTGNVYDVRNRILTDMDIYADNVNSYGMFIETMDTYHSDVENCVLVKLDASREQENVVLFSDEEIIIENNKALRSGTLNFICGRVYELEASPKHEVVISKTVKGSKEEVFRAELDNLEIENYQVDLGEIEKNTSIYIEFYDLAGNQIDKQEINKYFILNPVLTKK